MSNCENYISEEDIRALKESEQHIEHVARSRDSAGSKALSVTDTIRGESVTNRTLDGLEKLYTDKIESLGYQQMGDYATGINITARDQIVFYNGSWYMYRGGLPHVTTGATLPEDGGIWSDTNPDGLWVDVGDASLRSELKNGDGSLISVGFGTLRDNQYYVTPEQFASSMNGSDDWAIAINAALDYMESIGGGIVQLKPKTYSIKTQILVPANCTLRGSGKYSTHVVAHDSMPAELNCITTKNNPMYKKGANGKDPELEAYTYIDGVVIRDLLVDGNATGRYEDLMANGISEIQSCGIKITSARNVLIENCFVKDTIMHCYDVAASNYFFDGDGTHNIDGGSDGVTIRDCIGDSSLWDDIFTTHNSCNIHIQNCKALNTRINPYMAWGNNQHGFEIDDGSWDVTVVDCYAENLICGFQAKGHHGAKPANNIRFIRCHAKDNRFSFMVTCQTTLTENMGTGVLVADCISENPFNDTSKKYIDPNFPSTEIQRPRHMWWFGYHCSKVRNFTMIGGEGLYEIGHPGSITPAVDIDGIISKGGYSGIYSGLTAFGLVTVLSDLTTGRHVIKNVKVFDEINVPAVRCVDSKLTDGFVLENVDAIGSNSMACVMTNLNLPSNISGIKSTGFSCALLDTSTSRKYLNDLRFEVVNGLVHMVVPDMINGDIHPARVGNTAISLSTGIQYRANFNNNGVHGQWVKSSI